MILRGNESLRAQLELPLLERSFLFAVVSFFVLLPLSWVWSFFAYLRMLLRRKKASSHLDDVRIVSVGNVSVGGTGKSPLVRAVVRMALADGYDVAVMTRGYTASGASASSIVRVQNDMFSDSRGEWRSLSDETLEHALLLRDTVVTERALWIVQGQDRRTLYNQVVEHWRGLNEAQRRVSGCGLVVVLDDALQQTALPVHRDVIVWDPQSAQRAPLKCLPYGPYRMGFPIRRFWSLAVPRADVVVWSRLRTDSERDRFFNSIQSARKKLGALSSWDKVTQLLGRENLTLAQARVTRDGSFFELRSVSASSLTKSVRLLCGIARPERFKASVECYFLGQGLDVEIESCFAVSDHGEISGKSLRQIVSGVSVIVTLKDLSRWWQVAELREMMIRGQLFVLCLEVEILNLSFEHPKVSFDQLFRFQRA